MARILIHPGEHLADDYKLRLAAQEIGDALEEIPKHHSNVKPDARVDLSNFYNGMHHS